MSICTYLPCAHWKLSPCQAMNALGLVYCLGIVQEWRRGDQRGGMKIEEHQGRCQYTPVSASETGRWWFVASSSDACCAAMAQSNMVSIGQCHPPRLQGWDWTQMHWYNPEQHVEVMSIMNKLNFQLFHQRENFKVALPVPPVLEGIFAVKLPNLSITNHHTSISRAGCARFQIPIKLSKLLCSLSGSTILMT